MPLSGELGREVERVLARRGAGTSDAPEMRALQPLLRAAARACPPCPARTICCAEWVRARDGQPPVPLSVRGPRRARRPRRADRVALGPARAELVLVRGQRLWPGVVRRRRTPTSTSTLLAALLQPDALARRPDRQLQPHRTRAPPVPRDRARRRACCRRPCPAARRARCGSCRPPAACSTTCSRATIPTTCCSRRRSAKCSRSNSMSCAWRMRSPIARAAPWRCIARSR